MKKITSLAIYAWALLVFTVLAIPFIIVNAILKLIGKKLWYRGIPLMGKCMLRAHGLRASLSGSFPRTGNFVVIANHASYLDVFLLAQAMQGRSCSACAAHWVFWIPFFGWIMRLFDVVPLWRHDHERAVQGIEQAKQLTRIRHYDMIILPEGTRATAGELGPFKMGPFHLAHELGLDIVPLYILGAGKAKPKNRFILERVPIHIHIGDVIATTGYQNPKELRDAVEKRFKMQFAEQERMYLNRTV